MTEKQIKEKILKKFKEEIKGCMTISNPNDEKIKFKLKSYSGVYNNIKREGGKMGLTDLDKEWLSQNLTTKKEFNEFKVRQEKFNDEQKKFNDKVETFMIKQNKFNDEVKTFMVNQNKFNDKVETFMIKQNKFNKNHKH